MAANMLQIADMMHQRTWAMCLVCEGKFTFENPRDFVRHLRSEHCTKEGGSFVCRYGRNGVCPSLPVEGVSDVDYEAHVEKHHVGSSLKNENSHAAAASHCENRMIGYVQLPPISFKEENWTFFSSTQNLAAVLNDPNERKRSKEFFTRTWGAEFEPCEVPPLTLLQAVPKHYFSDYIRKIQFRIKNHEKVKKSFQSAEESGDLGDIGFSKAASSAVKRQGDKYLNNLDVIPKTFMDANFTLEDPETFKYVIPMTRLDTVDAKHRNRNALVTVPKNSLKLMQEKQAQDYGGPRKEFFRLILREIKEKYFDHGLRDLLAEEYITIGMIIGLSILQNGKLPQFLSDNIIHDIFMAEEKSQCVKYLIQGFEKFGIFQLTHFLDITEVALAHQISLRSEDFFHAVSSQDQLQDDVGQTNSEIKHLRTKIKQVQDVLCGGSLKFMQLMQLRSRYHSVHNKLKLMSAVQQTQPTIQLLLSTGDFVAALDLIYTTQEVLQLELGGIQSLRHLGSQLAELERVIERMMEADFIEFATTNLAKPLENYDEQDHVIDEERLVSVLFGLLRKQKFHFIHAYKEEAFATVKETVKETARNFISQSSVTDDSQGLRDAMQGLDFQGWFDMLEVVFTNVLQTLKRMKILHYSFLNVLAIAAGQDRTGSWSVEDSSAESSEILISAVQCGKLTNESKEILGGAGEMAQARCVKLINVRAKAGYLDALASTEFVCLSRSVEKFVSECEAVCGRHSRVLRTILVTQAKKFVERFHEEKKQKLSLILDNERWKQADVPAEFQTLVDSLVDGVPTSDREILSLPSNKQASSLSSFQKPASHLVVNGEKFAVTGTLLLVLNMIVEYCQCVDLMPMLTTDIMTRLFELMKMFNSRTCQLVLGAGALQLVGLKTITAKHLALASRCLEVVTLHIATFKSHFELRLPPKQYVLLGQFDQILKDYNNHRQEIFTKMATLMEELFVDQLLTVFLGMIYENENDANGIIKILQQLHKFVPCNADQEDSVYGDQGVAGDQLSVERAINGKMSLANGFTSEERLEGLHFEAADWHAGNKFLEWEVRPPMPSQVMRNIVKQIIKLHEALLAIFPATQVEIVMKDVKKSFKNVLAKKIATLGVKNDFGPQHGLVQSDLAYFSMNLKSLHGMKDVEDSLGDIWKLTNELRTSKPLPTMNKKALPNR